MKYQNVKNTKMLPIVIVHNNFTGKVCFSINVEKFCLSVVSLCFPSFCLNISKNLTATFIQCH